ncbi:MAG: carbamoyl-phosphate synthase large subunit [Dehalococcoidia bacterium]|jgi:acetyl/propionyl-CoA carboxylase alpha subunit/acetyl-CoA carboxylase carboxyltransferase component|nr:carbamoyl-phosphate synthase large subunit [Dehalococcoidia bacterium]
MPITKLLVANRGEIAIRIMRAAAELEIPTVAIAPEDDAASLHTRKADEVHQLPGAGAMAYLNVAQVIEAARATGADAIHPGYGFLSENPALARACSDAGITFVGPRTEMLELFGDKVRARQAAADAGVPILPGLDHAITVEEAHDFFAQLPHSASMIIKALAGGGGRGVRIVSDASEVDELYKRASSEAKAAFGNGDVYVEQLVPRARHIEVQIAGDGSGAIAEFGERDCSIQRRHQKLVEIAPAPGFPDELRQRIIDAAVSLGEATSYNSLGTVEFLVDATDLGPDSTFAFIEANARLQVEHTITEEVTSVDLVRLQIELAAGRSLDEIGVPRRHPNPRGVAIQARVNMETMRADGATVPSGGLISVFEPATGPGIRVDTFGYAGYTTSPRYDSLLAKLITHTPSPSFHDALARTYRALCEFRIEGVDTNVPFLQALVRNPEVTSANLYTRFVDDHMADLATAAAAEHPRLFFEEAAVPDVAPLHAGVELGTTDPLAVLSHGIASRDRTLASSATASGSPIPEAAPAPEGTVAVGAPVQGTIVAIDIAEGDEVRVGQQLLIMEAMKMEHEVVATTAGIVRRILVTVGDTIYDNQPLLFIEESEVAAADDVEVEEVDLDYFRPDLDEVETRRATTLDSARQWAVDRRRRTGQQTTRESVAQLFDEGSFVEYGQLVLAAQRRRRSLEDLIEKTSADGMVIGIGSVNGDKFENPADRVALIAYDYTVLAGTQGQRNHRKTDRMIDVAARTRTPLVLFSEGGGGRPGDTDEGGGGSQTFAHFPQLSGLIPLVGITSGRCFAGNASVLACCDIIIATANSNIGMGGPAMIEGGGLGVFAPEDIGGMDVQVPNGVVDIAVEDEVEAIEVAKQYLSYFQGTVSDWEAPDQRKMRRIVPENRLRVYNIREVIDTIADIGSVLELRKGFGHGMVTSFIRVEGRPVGIVANNPAHIGGAIDSDAADKGARFMQICDAFDIPVLFLCDTPGIMVGPEIERTALVRHANRMFLVGSNLEVPSFTIIIRKAYGLGAIAMAGGNYTQPLYTVAWPTGEFHGMGIEGSVKLGYRKELAAIEDPEERLEAYQDRVDQAYEAGKAINRAAAFGIDDTIDPADSRRWLAGLLKSLPPTPVREGKKRPFIDSW